MHNHDTVPLREGIFNCNIENLDSEMSREIWSDMTGTTQSKLYTQEHMIKSIILSSHSILHNFIQVRAEIPSTLGKYQAGVQSFQSLVGPCTGYVHHPLY